jgi:hypothetical protein
MKRILVLITALLMISSVGIARAQDVPIGPFCFAWANYCDGLELSLNMQTNVITGSWINTDCAGTDVPITWGKRMNGPVGYGGYVLATLPALPGYNWAFFIDWPVDGTCDMYLDQGSGYGIWIDELAYNLSAGPCPFAVQIEGESATTWAE